MQGSSWSLFVTAQSGRTDEPQNEGRIVGFVARPARGANEPRAAKYAAIAGRAFVDVFAVGVGAGFGRQGVFARAAQTEGKFPKGARVVLMDDVRDLVAERVEDFVPAVFGKRGPRQHNQTVAMPVVAAVLLTGGKFDVA